MTTLTKVNRWSRYAIETAIVKWGRRVTIFALVLVTTLPFYYMVLLSFRPIESLLLDPGALFMSLDQITFDTYAKVLKPTEEGGNGFVQLLWNSLLVSLATVIVGLVVSISGAYAVSRLAFKGRKQISAFFYAIYLSPPLVMAIPLFVIFSRLGIRQSLLGLMLVYIALTIPVAIFMLRGYFATIPKSLEEAALLDGCTYPQILRKIILPLILPSVMATGLYIFMIAWNEFLFALLFLVTSRENWTVSLGLSQLSGSLEVPTTVLMAGSVILTVPVVVLFFFAERLLVDGLTAGAEKG